VLTLNPSFKPAPGTSVAAHGVNFVPNATVQLFADDTLIATASTLSDGSFSTTFTMPVGTSPDSIDITAMSFGAPFTDGQHVESDAVLYQDIGLAGDVNKDGVINTADLVLIQASIGSKLGDPNFNPQADLNRDGRIDISDLQIAARNVK